MPLSKLWVSSVWNCDICTFSKACHITNCTLVKMCNCCTLKTFGFPALGIIIKHLHTIHTERVSWMAISLGSGSVVNTEEIGSNTELVQMFSTLYLLHLGWFSELITFADILHLTTWSIEGAFLSWSRLCWNTRHLMVLCVITFKMYLNWIPKKYLRYLIVILYWLNVKFLASIAFIITLRLACKSEFAQSCDCMTSSLTYYGRWQALGKVMGVHPFGNFNCVFFPNFSSCLQAFFWFHPTPVACLFLN